MKKLYALGDCHFSTSRDWDREVFNNFLNWFEKLDFGPKEDCELIQLGDVTERSSNLGDTLELMTKFFKICCDKFHKIYLVGGNHDHKNIHNKSQFSTQFLKYLGNIETIYQERLFHTDNGFHVMALPYRRVEGKVLDDYYSNELPEEFYKTSVDLFCGHVALKEPKTFYGGITASHFKKPKAKAFGHIHTRNGIYKDAYIGSISSFKIDEKNTELPRVIRCLTKNEKCIIQEDLEIPVFIEYETLQFGEHPKRNKTNKTQIFTITNCKNIQQAKTQYPNLYIRGIEKIKNDINVRANEKSEHFITPLHALENMITETKIVIKRKTLSLLKTILS